MEAAVRQVNNIDANYSDTITLIPRDGKLVPVDLKAQKATVDTRFVYFEAYNTNSAQKRLSRYRNDFNKLCNLKPVRDGKINFA